MEDPFDLGAYAASNKPRSANPYDVDSEDWQSWNEGYDSRKGLDEDGEPLED